MQALKLFKIYHGTLVEGLRFAWPGGRVQSSNIWLNWHCIFLIIQQCFPRSSKTHFSFLLIFNPFIYLKSWRVRLPWLNILLIDPLEHIAGDRSVEEGVEADEDVRLDHVHPVQVLAENRRQAHFSQFLQLICNNMFQHNTVLYKHQFVYGPLVKAEGGMLFSYQNLGGKG